MNTVAGMTTIHIVANQAPELALLTAIVARAVTDAKTGDISAVVRIRSQECLDILVWIAPDEIDPRCLPGRLLMKLEESGL
jgi:hypothetical protein